MWEPDVKDQGALREEAWLPCRACDSAPRRKGGPTDANGAWAYRALSLVLGAG